MSKWQFSSRHRYDHMKFEFSRNKCLESPRCEKGACAFWIVYINLAPSGLWIFSLPSSLPSFFIIPWVPILVSLPNYERLVLQGVSHGTSAFLSATLLAPLSRCPRAGAVGKGSAPWTSYFQYHTISTLLQSFYPYSRFSFVSASYIRFHQLSPVMIHGVFRSQDLVSFIYA